MFVKYLTPFPAESSEDMCEHGTLSRCCLENCSVDVEYPLALNKYKIQLDIYKLLRFTPSLLRQITDYNKLYKYLGSKIDAFRAKTSSLSYSSSSSESSTTSIFTVGGILRSKLSLSSDNIFDVILRNQCGTIIYLLLAGFQKSLQSLNT